MRGWAFVLLLAAAGCRFVTRVSDSPCSGDGDCDLVGAAPPSCCTTCRPVAATKATAASARSACEDVSGGPPRCPSLDCPCERSSAVCRAGRCEVDVKPCN